jgi:hypothetical protein
MLLDLLYIIDSTESVNAFIWHVFLNGVECSRSRLTRATMIEAHNGNFAAALQGSPVSSEATTTRLLCAHCSVLSASHFFCWTSESSAVKQRCFTEETLSQAVSPKSVDWDQQGL